MVKIHPVQQRKNSRHRFFTQTFQEGKALLLPLQVADIYGICKSEFIFGVSDISYNGFLVKENCGTIIWNDEEVHESQRRQWRQRVIRSAGNQASAGNSR